MYPTYTCWPPMSRNPQAYLTLNSFEAGGDGGSPSKCDNKYHNDNMPVVTLSTGWYNNGKRCHNNITFNGLCFRVPDHDYQPPCPNKTVDASKAVWIALVASMDNWGDLILHALLHNDQYCPPC